jgi:hypothetical protein
MPSQAVYLARFSTALCGLVLAGAAFGESPKPKPIDWCTDYRAARNAAEAEQKMLLVWFRDPARAGDDDKFAAETFGVPAIVEQVSCQYIAAKVLVDAELKINGKPAKLLAHAAFAELRGQPGLAIIDLTDAASPQFGYVISVYPLAHRTISAEHLNVLLDLPSGSLTQRTLIFALRTHPKRPASTNAELLPLLADEASRHSQHQASIRLQGHHGWNERFHSLNARLPAGLVAYEVCAESWPSQSLLEAAEECVESWHHSSGHWRQVSTRPEYFGYDLRRGANGVWYATGLFARRR